MFSINQDKLLFIIVKLLICKLNSLFNDTSLPCVKYFKYLSFGLRITPCLISGLNKNKNTHLIYLLRNIVAMPLININSYHFSEEPNENFLH